MFGIEVGFYALGFVSCLLIITIIEEVNDKDKTNKKALKRKYRAMLKKQQIESNQNDIEIDIKI